MRDIQMSHAFCKVLFWPMADYYDNIKWNGEYIIALPVAPDTRCTIYEKDNHTIYSE